MSETQYSFDFELTFNWGGFITRGCLYYSCAVFKHCETSIICLIHNWELIDSLFDEQELQYLAKKDRKHFVVQAARILNHYKYCFWLSLKYVNFVFMKLLLTFFHYLLKSQQLIDGENHYQLLPRSTPWAFCMKRVCGAGF